MIDLASLKGASVGDRPVIGIAIGDQQVWPTAGPEPIRPPAHLANRAAWTWFHDPRAIHHDGVTYLTWAGQDGIYVDSLTDEGAQWTTRLAANTANDHSVAALHARADGRILAVYSAHNGTMYQRVTTSPGDITEWGAEVVVQSGSCTYPNLVALGPSLFLFYRHAHGGGFDRGQCYRTSTDGGDTWSSETVLIANGRRPYCRYVGDGVDQIHVLASTDNPNQMDTSSVHYLHYDAGTWRDAAGVDLGSPPFDTADLSVVYDGSTNRGWVWDIALDDGTPVVLFTRLISSSDHRYHYGRWNGTSWEHSELVAAGGTICPGTGEPYYTSGAVFDHDDPSIVYLTREVEPGRWELERWTTPDDGATWSSVALTEDSTVKNFRPYVPQGSPIDVLWCRGDYTTYTNFASAIVALPPTETDASELSPYQAVVLEDDPAAFWPLDDPAETTSPDVSSFPRHPGTYVGAATHNAAGPFTGAASAEIPLSPSTGYIEVPDRDVFSPTDLSIEAWLRVDSWSGSRAVLGKENNGSAPHGEWLAYVQSSGQAVLILRSAGNTVVRNVTTVDSLPTGEWVHVVWTTTGNSHAVYLNGAAVAVSTSGSGTRNGNTSNPVTIGGRRGSNLPFGGLLSNVAFYDKVLSPEQVAAHYAAAH